jgi:hypothetical protein
MSNNTLDRLIAEAEFLVAKGIQPFPMVFDCRAKDAALYRRLKQFQRWVVTGLYRAVPFTDYDAGYKSDRSVAAQLQMFA